MGQIVGASIALFIAAVIVLILMLFNGGKRERIRKEPGWRFDRVDSYNRYIDIYVNTRTGEELRIRKNV